MKLGDIAEVRSGLVLSRKKSTDGSGVSYRALNFRAMGADGCINEEELDSFLSAEALPPEYVSHIGDVIVRLTAPYTAVLIDRSTEGMVISSNFVIIREYGKDFLPEYLFWLLNTPKVKYDIYENATSNMLGAVKARYFTEFQIQAVPMDRQQRIAEMNLLARREVSLLNRLAKEKEIYYAAVIDRMQREVRTHDESK